MRGRLKNWLFFDAGVYALSYNNRIGEVLKAETRINAFGENEETVGLFVSVAISVLPLFMDLRVLLI